MSRLGTAVLILAFAAPVAALSIASDVQRLRAANAYQAERLRTGMIFRDDGIHAPPECVRANVSERCVAAAGSDSAESAESSTP